MTRGMNRLRWAGPLALAWLACTGAGYAATPDELARGKALFLSVKPACAVCHTLQAAGSQGQVGPVLDELQPDAQRVLRVLRGGLGVMPSYEEQLSEDDMKALASFVSHSTGAAPLPR